MCVYTHHGRNICGAHEQACMTVEEVAELPRTLFRPVLVPDTTNVQVHSRVRLLCIESSLYASHRILYNLYMQSLRFLMFAGLWNGSFEGHASHRCAVWGYVCGVSLLLSTPSPFFFSSAPMAFLYAIGNTFHMLDYVVRRFVASQTLRKTPLKQLLGYACSVC